MNIGNTRKKTLLFLLSLLLILPVLTFSPAQTAAAPAAKTKQVVGVTVATLWTSPGLARAIDAPSLTSPADIKAWTAAMNTADKRRWLTGKTETQALYGREVKVLQTKGTWVKVAVLDQATSKSSDGYPGWLPAVQLKTVPAADWEPSAGKTATVGAKTAQLYRANGQTKLLELSFGTRLPVVSESGKWIEVRTPQYGTAKLLAADVELTEPGAKTQQPTGEQLVETGKAFLGLPYLWAGVSAYGFDCSGFTGALYGYYGISLPRDASEQFRAGTAVSKANMQPGDLMFFAHNNGKGGIHHVAMYIGGGKMMHSPKAGRTVEIIPISTAGYANEFAGARRYLND
ncbi:C40 family peptidase [Saccharibacillus sp. CPCC 101409]|uniref:C40 family peptidase n=1 Tax=Saccharibacillus sp. CPCC 101409 TaxID=3058041 RepID=UPI002670DD67|nr:C40 family peptidase [Saccharibacillus sp. CPCC 101409]MDO3411643.1 C40 family peptidase [Saccharibacillus sp. CPCC 101409]